MTSTIQVCSNFIEPEQRSRRRGQARAVERVEHDAHETPARCIERAEQGELRGGRQRDGRGLGARADLAGARPHPHTTNPRPKTQVLHIQNPNPEIRNTKPETRNPQRPELDTRRPERETRNTKCRARAAVGASRRCSVVKLNPKPETPMLS